MKRARKSLLLFQTAVTAAKAAFLPLSAVAALAKFGHAIEEFEQAMRSSLAIMRDVSDAMKEDMTKAAIEMARATKFSAAQVAESFFFLASAGLDAEQSLKALPVVAQFAQAGMFNMARATDLLTDAQSALGLTVDDTAENVKNMIRVSDVLVKANTLSNATVQQFSEALTTKAGPALKFLNKSIEEGVAVLAAFADQGVKAGEAGTALNIILRDLTSKAIRNKEEFDRLGIEVFDSAGKMKNLASIVRDLENALEGLSDQQRKNLLLTLGFSDKSVVFTQTLIGTSQAIGEYQRGLENAAGITQKVSDDQLTPFIKGWNDLTGAIVGFGTAFDPVTHALGGLFSAFAKVVALPTDLAEAIAESEVGAKIAAAQLEGTQKLLKLRIAIRKERDAQARGDLRAGPPSIKSPFLLEDIVKANELVRELVQRTESFGKAASEVAFAQLKDLVAGGVDVVVLAEALDAIEKLSRQEQLTEMKGIIAGLTREIAVFGKTSEEILLGQLKAFVDAAGPGEQLHDIVTAVFDLLDKQEFQALEAAGKAIEDEMITPLEKFNSTWEDLQKLLAGDFISEAGFMFKIAEARQELENAMKAIDKGTRGRVDFRTRQELGIVAGATFPRAFASGRVEQKTQLAQLNVLKNIDTRIAEIQRSGGGLT